MKTIANQPVAGAKFGTGVLRSLPSLAAWISGAGMVFALSAACFAESSSFMDPQGPIAAAQKAHFIKVIAITMIAVGPVLVLVPLMLWRYRYRNTKARYSPNWEFSGPLDLVMWGVPFLIIIALSTQLWHSTKALDPYKPISSPLPALEVKVIALDWKWLFLYPEQGIGSIGELVFPAGRPVALTLTSDTVMQSFMISALAGQIYVMPGMQTQLQVLADAPGVFEGENTQFNGFGFVAQKFKAKAVTDADFEAWTASVRSDGIPLDMSSYATLAIPSTPTQAHTALATDAMPPAILYFNPVPPDLFSTVIHRYHSGQPILPADQPGGAVYDPARNGAQSTSKASAPQEVSQ